MTKISELNKQQSKQVDYLHRGRAFMSRPTSAMYRYDPSPYRSTGVSYNGGNQTYVQSKLPKNIKMKNTK